MKYKPLPIGIDNFEELVTKEYYYVDKTHLIQKLLDYRSKVTLFTRPRRFGKSLNLSMLQAYFENNGDRRHLFEGLHILEAGENYTKHLGKYPVIMLNFKEGKQSDFQTSYEKLRRSICSEFNRHRKHIELSRLDETDRREYLQIQNGENGFELLTNSIALLSKCLEKSYGEKVIILIDEYDVPLENAYFHGFYEEMVSFIRSLLSVALKTNNSLEFAIMTGCLRISKESIFTGLNNLEIVSIQDKNYGEFFGFTNQEVAQMLEYYEKTQLMEGIKAWYDGYVFGEADVYNPWSVLNHMKQLLADETSFPLPYWSNTSSNMIIRELINRADGEAKVELETLLAGGAIEKPIYEDITYQEVYKNSDSLWNFLFFTGYLKKKSERQEGRTIFVTLCIPNEEVLCIYENHITEWWNDRIKEKDFTTLYRATLEGDIDIMNQEIEALLLTSISYHDAIEAFYHGFIAGIFMRLDGYRVLSNREAGYGRSDVIIKPVDYQKPAIVMEFKVANKYRELSLAAKEAIMQSQVKQYEAELYEEGYDNIVVYGMGFYRKNCKIYDKQSVNKVINLIK